MAQAPSLNDSPAESPSISLRDQVRTAVIWRSGAQILGQLVTWTATFLVIRILSPADYGLYAMTSVVLNLLALVNGYGLANAVIQQKDLAPNTLRQLFGMLILLNGVLGGIQIVAAPYVAAYYGQPLVGEMLRWQALLYITNPFLALGFAILSRRMEFRSQAQVNLVSAIAGGLAALGGALAGMGVWALVLSPIVTFGTRAIGMTIAARSLMWPSFNFAGAARILSFGGLVTLSSFFWFVQTQSDVLIGGRVLEAGELGLYTTSLFLTLMFVTKFVPPVNEIAFSAYAKIQDDTSAIGFGFLKSVRVIFLAAIPFGFGLASVSQQFVPLVLGEQWANAAPVVAILGIAMPFMTMQVLFGPAVNATGKPAIMTGISLLGAVLLTACYLAGVRFGVMGLTASWLVGYPLLVAISAVILLPKIGASVPGLMQAVAPPVIAGAVMFAGVRLAQGAIPAGQDPVLELIGLVALGGVIYGGVLLLIARDRIAELLDLVRRRRAPG